MTTKTTMTRTIRLAIGTAAVLALMSQAAQARPNGVSQRTGLPVGVGVQTSPPTQKGTDPLIAVHHPGTPEGNVALEHNHAAATGKAKRWLVQLGFGQLGFGQLGHRTPPTQTVSVKANADGFDWVAAAIGVGSPVIVVLIAATALTARGRRRVPLST